MKRDLAWLVVATLAMASVALAQGSASKDGPKKHGSNGASSEAVLRGKRVFDKKCAVCHYTASGARKVGPGLKGMNKRGTFSANGNKITDESLKAWIENGNNLMPPFKDVLDAEELKNIIRYVKTL